jgi:hypothetical protein
MDVINKATSLSHAIIQFLVHAQKAREFEDEFERHQLRLDILQARLFLQIEALNMNDDNTRALEGQERSLAEIFVAVQHTLFKAQRVATEMRTDLAASINANCDAGSCGPPLGEQPARLRALAFLDRRRLQTIKAIGRMKWAIYKRDRFDRSLADIAALVADLERLASNQG